MTEIEILYEQICKGNDLRSSMRKLNEMLADQKRKRQFAYQLGGDFRVLARLLSHEDPKVRRLAALLLGQMETEDVLPDLMGAWKREKTLFVRYAYPEAMKHLDVSEYVEELKEIEKRLLQTKVEETSEVHIRLELSKLHELLLPYERSRHMLNMSLPAKQVVLICPAGCSQLTAQMITIGCAEEKGSSVHVRDGSWEELLRIRTWSQLLIPLSACSPQVLPADPRALGRVLGNMGIAEFLNEMCTGTGRWKYRLDIASLREDGRSLRAICGEIDRASKGSLANDTGEYELTIRLLPRRDGNYSGFLKLSILPDHRFDYRREYISDSMTGVTAACVAAISRKYAGNASHANVLDPFCGVGTLLMERRYLNTDSTDGASNDGNGVNNTESRLSLYGTDINGEAIEKGRANALRAHMPINLINRDFFDFSHEYLFDEVITDMPRLRKGGKIQNTAACRKFFAAVPKYLKNRAVVTVYTFDEKDVLHCAAVPGCFECLTSVRLNEKSGAAVLVFRYIGND